MFRLLLHARLALALVLLSTCLTVAPGRAQVALCNMSGTISLVGCANSIQPITLEFRSLSGKPTFCRSVLLFEEGEFWVKELPQDTYLLHIKGTKWLATNLFLDTTWGDVNGIEVPLLPGDINGDNRCDIFDLAAFAEAFNTLPPDANWNEGADLDCNTRVDIYDLGLLARSFNKEGDL